MSKRVTTRHRRVVVAAVTSATVAAGLLLGGCSATNPITTQANYAASDGVNVEVGDLRLTNVLVLSAGGGEPGTVVGSVTNDGDDARVTITVGGEEVVSMRVRSGSTVLMGGTDGEVVEVENVSEPAGAYVDVTIRTDAGSTTTGVPVLDGTLPEYREYAPAPERPEEDETPEETTELGDEGADGNTEN